MFVLFWAHMLHLAATEPLASDRWPWVLVVLLGFLPGAFLYSMARLPRRDREEASHLAKRTRAR